MRFTNLAAELQIQIFSYFSNNDLKSVRAVSTCCRDNASVWLFHTVIACARYTAMGAFQNISLHPAYQKYVKEIIFDATEYDKKLATDERVYHAAVDQIPELKNALSWQRHARFKTYQARYKEQETIKDDGVLLQTIAKALDWMPNVHTIVYTSLTRDIPLERKDTRDLLPRYISYSDRTWNHPSDPSNEHRPRLGSGFHHLIGAVAVANYTQIRAFRVEPHLGCAPPYQPNCFAFATKVFEFTHPDHLAAGKLFFHNLTTLDLSFAMFLREGSVDGFVNLHALLSEAKGLRRLRMGVDNSVARFTSTPSTWPAGRDTEFGMLGLHTVWPELRHVYLSGLSASEKEIRKMLARGHGVLEEVRFSSCILRRGRWSNLVEEVVCGTAGVGGFVLDSVEEDDVWGLPYESRGEAVKACCYQGCVRTDGKGERYFEEPEGKSIYAWRKYFPVEE